MPKPIKKRITKPVKPEEGVKDVLYGARDFISERQKIFYPVIIALVIIALGAGGFSIYRSNVKAKAEALAYEGYRFYYGLYQKQTLPKEAQYQMALEKFKKAYETRESPLSLFYIANCYYTMGNYDEALKALRELNERFPNDERFLPLSQHKISVIHLKKGDKEAALKALDDMYRAKTGSLKDLALMESARLLDGMGKRDDSMKRYEELAKNFPGSPFAEEAKAKIGEKKG